MTFPMRRPVPDRRGWSTRPKPMIGRRGFALLMLVALAGGTFVSAPPAPAAADDLSDAYAKQTALQQQIAASKAALKSLTASATSLSTKIASTKATLAEVVSNIAEVKTSIIEMTVQVANAKNALDAMQTTVSRLDHQLADVVAEQQAKQAELEARKAILADRIRTAYDTDRTSMLETFLSSDDFTDVISEVGYQLDFAGQDKILAEQIIEDQKVLTVMKQTVTETMAQAVEMHALADTQKATLDRQMADLAAANARLLKLEEQTRKILAEQRARYATLLANKAKLKATLAAQAKAEKQLEALIQKLVLEALQAGGIPSQFSGSFMWPMPGVITQNFGCTGFYLEPAYGSCPHFHRGIDIAAPMDTPIRAAGAGKVILAGKSPYDSAWIVVIAHSTHLVSWYAHVDDHPGPVVRVDQYVYKGQLIAYEGVTGNTTGPHLHWAVQLDNVWVNPRLFL